MPAEDHEVLEFVGGEGKSPEEISERFPAFNFLRLVHAGFVEEQDIEVAETQAHGSPQLIRRYVLTARGAEAVGIDPLTLRRP